MIGRLDGEARVTRLAMDERERVVAKREIRTEIDGLLQFAQGLVLTAAQPECPPHRPVRRRIMVVDEKAVAGRLEGAIAFSRAIAPALEGVLPMRERQAGI